MIKAITVDCGYLLPEFAASYLLTDGERAAFIDNGTARSVPALLEALRANGLGPESVDFVIVTHVHLDHAGGSSELMKACPNALLLAHPRAAKHLKDPSKLVASAKQVYGEAEFEKLYGTIEPIPESRIRAIEDGSELEWQSANLKFLHTRGHANHHFCVLWSEEGLAQAIFTGDAFGVCYPAIQRSGTEKPLIFPSSSPTDFDPAEARASVRRIMSCGAPVAYPTHFGPVRDIGGAGARLLEELDFSEELLNEATRSAMDGKELERFCRERLEKHYSEVFDRLGTRWDDEAKRVLGLDLELNAQGIAYVAIKRRSGK